jgi:hypothetical protein
MCYRLRSDRASRGNTIPRVALHGATTSSVPKRLSDAPAGLLWDRLLVWKAHAVIYSPHPAP